MKKNIGSVDRIARIIIAAIIAILYFTNTITGIFGITLLIIAAVLLLTSFINFCPLYFLFGINTSKTKSI
jgi:hypothetical protein